MPNILFASNSISHFPGTILDSTAWTYDSNRVPYSIKTQLSTIASSPLLEQSTSDETWFHFRHGSNHWYVNNDEPIVEIVDDEGNRIMKMSYHNRGTDGYNVRFTMDGQTFYDERYIPMLTNSVRTYDIRIVHTGILARCEVYVNEIQLSVIEFAITSPTLPSYLWIGGAEGDNGTGQGFYSEFIVADADTRNARLDLLRPVAAGAYGNWDGPLSSLSDDDPTTGMTTTLANQNQSTTLEAYTGADNISNVVQVTTTVRGINSPENLQHLIRMSAVDYLTASFAVPFNKDFQVTDWKTNPATSSPWTSADLVGAEFGFRSIA